MKKRKEKDSFGFLELPHDAYYGVHTQRSLNIFAVSRKKWHSEIITSIAQLKIACAAANKELGYLSPKKTAAIQRACKKIIRGEFEDQFPLDIFQSGSGTGTHMNVNEVIANCANELLNGRRGDRTLVHPNDDVNKGQSTNNVIPSAIKIACVVLTDHLLKNFTAMIKAFEKKAKEFNPVLKLARTHLQDAVPIYLGQEFRAYVTALSKHQNRLKKARAHLCVLGIGGNAVGTGLNTHPKFRSLIIKHLHKTTKQAFRKSTDGVESTQFLTDIAALSGVLKLIAIDLNKIANDLRMLSSGPKTGFGEINLPPIEAGSSIMPGKINPAIPEMVNMVCHRVFGNDLTITTSCSSGNLNLNTHLPIIGDVIVESLEILNNACSIFAQKCISGMTANKEVCEKYAYNDMALATALTPLLGYDKISRVMHESLTTDRPLKEIILEKGYLTTQELEIIFEPKNLTKPNLR